MRVTESIENYLEAILMLSQTNPVVRAIDIANLLGVTKPSVSHATKLMREQKQIVISTDGAITLTPAGEAIAKEVFHKHNTLAKFFISMGVSEKTAYRDACLIEHDISEETFAAISEKVRQMQ